MRKCGFLLLFLMLTCLATFGQPKLIVNEFSQGSGGTKEFIELLVVGTRTCNDSTMDLRNWIFDDHNGWYGGSGTGIAAGHFRFKDIPEWQAIPYGSLILIYNHMDRNLKIPAGADDPVDANGDYVYILSISSSLLEQNVDEPVSPSSSTYQYPTSGYGATTDWVPIGLANGGDAVIVVDPANRSTAHFSVQYGFVPATGAQTPNVNLGPVASASNAFVSADEFSSASGWTIGVVNTADETPGEGNTAANSAWIQSMRVQSGSSFTVTLTTVQPTCTVATGSITVTEPLGTDYTYSIDGTNFQSSPNFTNVASGNYTVTVKDLNGCTGTASVDLTASGSVPSAPVVTIQHPTCTVQTGSVEVTSPTGTNFTYSIDGTNFQSSTQFTALTPGNYTITVKDDAGCVNSTAVVVENVPATPDVPVLIVTQPSCTSPGGVITITEPTGSAFSYSIDDINYQTAPVFTGLVPATYTVFVQNTEGCKSQASVTINAVPNAPAAPAVTSPVYYCKDDTPSALTAVGTDLLWYTAATGGTGDVNAPVPSTSTTGSVSYFVSQSDNGCESDRAEIIVTVTELNLDPIAGNNQICVQGNTVAQLTNTHPNGVWSSGNTNIATVNSDGLVTAVGAGTVVINYLVQEDACTASVDFSIQVTNFEVVLSASANPADQGSSVVLTSSSTDPYTVLNWLPDGTFPGSTALSQTITANETTDFGVVAQNANGCIDTAWLNLVVIPTNSEIFIPTAFTPNGDGINDIFKAYGNTIQQIEMWVYNQWGEKIFYSGNGLSGWNGRHNGKLQPSGVYIYIMQIQLSGNGEIIKRKGSVNLIR